MAAMANPSLRKFLVALIGAVCLNAEGANPTEEAARENWKALHKTLIGNSEWRPASVIGQNIRVTCGRRTTKPELTLSAEDTGEPQITIRLTPARPHSREAIEIRRVANYPAAFLEVDLSGTVRSIDWEKREIVVEVISIKTGAAI